MRTSSHVLIRVGPPHTRVPYIGLSPLDLKTYRGTCSQTTRETTMSHYSTATAACATVPCGRSQHQTVQPTTAMLWLLCYEQSRLSTKGSYVARLDGRRLLPSEYTALCSGIRGWLDSCSPHFSCRRRRRLLPLNCVRFVRIVGT